jgi:hypothetical protein
MAPITDENPAGVETFDHSPISALPEYAAASRALDNLVHAIKRARVGLGQDGWLRTVQEMVSALPHSDICRTCARSSGDGHDIPLPAPDGAEVQSGRLSGRYVCPRCGSRWTRTYAINIPSFLV